MARGRKASQTKKKILALLFGEQFTGKSTLASQLAYFKREDGRPFRVLYIDAESGSIDHYLDRMADEGVNLDNIYIVYTQSPAEVKQYVSMVRNNQDLLEIDDEGNYTGGIVYDADGEPFRADAIVVDGTTILNMSSRQGRFEFSKVRNRAKAVKKELVGDEYLAAVEGAGLEYKDYQKINFDGNDLILDLLACGAHVAITARETDEKMTVKNSKGDDVSIATGRKIPDGYKGIGHNVNTEIRLFYRSDDPETICAEIIKDRTGIHQKGDIITNPTLLDYQKVIDDGKDLADFIIKNDLQEAVRKEQEIYSKELMGQSNQSQQNNTSGNQPAKKISKEDSLISARKEVISELRLLSPVDNKRMKDKLSELKIPTDFASITKIETFETIKKLIDELN